MIVKSFRGSNVSFGKLIRIIFNIYSEFIIHYKIHLKKNQCCYAVVFKTIFIIINTLLSFFQLCFKLRKHYLFSMH